MRTVNPRSIANRDLRRRVERLERLPLRADTARLLLDRLREEPEPLSSPPDRPGARRGRSALDLDPGWAAALSRFGETVDPTSVLADSTWWSASPRASGDALDRLWRHSVAASLAANRLARDNQHPEPADVGRLAFLLDLGLWAVASLDTEWLARWSEREDLAGRREYERETLGQEAGSLTVALAERWGLGEALYEAAWRLHAPPLSFAPVGGMTTVRLLLDGYRQAEQTPWAHSPARQGWPETADPNLRLLIAEVQARCSAPFVDPSANPREERLTRENALLTRRVRFLEAGQAERDRFLDAFAAADPAESAEGWAERAGLVLCKSTGVTAARVEWAGLDPDDGDDPATRNEHAPDVKIPLESGPRRIATLKLWTGPGSERTESTIAATLPAWTAWARRVDHRVGLETRLHALLQALRGRDDADGVGARAEKLEALAEFAAGAGHELNNPLAVILGRAQLLMTRESDPQALRSLRAIMTQAQRAHRILRDLMYVARPPEPRPRSCLADEVWRSSLRDARPDAEERGVALLWEGLDQGLKVWADPDGLRHLADSLIRNAIEASTPGGAVRVSSSPGPEWLRWTVTDDGRGLSPAEARHLFDPFFCGRQAGRGLGMGLPRAYRYVSLVGGAIEWRSSPGQGSSFMVRLPLEMPPGPPPVDAGGGPAFAEPAQPAA